MLDIEPFSQSMMVNIERDIDRIQELYRRFHFKCRTCKAPLPFDEATTDKHIATWLVGSKTIPPTTQISTLKCECGASTCVGCGNEPVIHHDRSFWTPLGVVNHCCDDGRLWGIWLILLRFDGQVVKLKEENKAAPPSARHPASRSAGLSGIGYADDDDIDLIDPLDMTDDELSDLDDEDLCDIMIETAADESKAVAASYKASIADFEMLSEEDHQDYIISLATPKTKAMITAQTKASKDAGVSVKALPAQTKNKASKLQSTASPSSGWGFPHKLAKASILKSKKEAYKPAPSKTPIGGKGMTDVYLLDGKNAYLAIQDAKKEVNHKIAMSSILFGNSSQAHHAPPGFQHATPQSFAGLQPLMPKTWAGVIQPPPGSEPPSVLEPPSSPLGKESKSSIMVHGLPSKGWKGWNPLTSLPYSSTPPTNDIVSEVPSNGFPSTEIFGKIPQLNTKLSDFKPINPAKLQQIKDQMVLNHQSTHEKFKKIVALAPSSFSPSYTPVRRSSISPGNPLDSITTKTLKLLVGFFQPPQKDEIILLYLSLLMDQLKELARNDSIDDMTKRKDVYHAMYDFIAHIINIELSSVVIDDIQSGVGLDSFGERRTTLLYNGNTTTSQSVSWLRCNQNSYEQAILFQDLATKSKSNPDADITRLCDDLIRIQKILLAADAKDTHHVTEAKGADSWTQFWKDNKLTFSYDVVKSHALYQPSQISSTPARNRMNIIIKEVANMRTSLPEGIFVKVDEANTDLMKILIVGVEGTPYAGGLFPFDLLLGDDYPMSPPKIRFVLENVDSDGHHINPNLHVGGQVCLSILNTWAGTSDEMWQPNKSTILAVLVSIQAMILGACHPWENEPGEEYRADTPASAQYNLMVQSKTVKYGMIPFLQEKTKGPSAFISASHIWKDVAAAYWKYNGDKILATVQEWAQTNERIQNYHASDNLVSRRAPKGKQKARAGEDLLFTLTSLISLDTATEKSKREASSLTTPPKRQKTDAFIEPRSASGYRSSSSSKPTETWRYNGPRKLADVRAACDELGVSPANSIQKSVDRMEQSVKEEQWGSPAAKKWGNVDIIND